MAIILWKAEVMTVTTMTLMISVRVLMYNLINQVNDTAVELSRPHWLRTFAGTRLGIFGCCMVADANEDIVSVSAGTHHQTVLSGNNRVQIVHCSKHALRALLGRRRGR